MNSFTVRPIGLIKQKGGASLIQLAEEFIPGLRETEGFSHMNVLWWFDGLDQEENRQILESPTPYKKGPQSMGVFATRSPLRPNPLALSTVRVLSIDPKKGLLHIAYIDANDNSPVIDLKPYTPSLDRVKSPEVPPWCAHWPKSLEESETFPWEGEFTF